MKKFELVRKYFTEYSTIGELFLEGNFVCFILEDKDRMLDSEWPIEKIKETKVYGRTAIPTGEYRVEWTYSNKYKRVMPELLKVKGYQGIRIHSGNTPEDTEGCLIPGLKMTTDNVSSSRDAVSKLYNILKIASDNREQIFINIKRKL